MHWRRQVALAYCIVGGMVVLVMCIAALRVKLRRAIDRGVLLGLLWCWTSHVAALWMAILFAVCLSLCLSVCLSVCVSICLSTWFVCLSVDLICDCICFTFGKAHCIVERIRDSHFSMCLIWCWLGISGLLRHWYVGGWKTFFPFASLRLRKVRICWCLND